MKVTLLLEIFSKFWGQSKRKFTEQKFKKNHKILNSNNFEILIGKNDAVRCDIYQTREIQEFLDPINRGFADDLDPRWGDFSNKDNKLATNTFKLLSLSGIKFAEAKWRFAKYKIYWGNECVKSELHDTPNMLMRSIARRTRASVPYLMPFKCNSNTYDCVRLGLLSYIRSIRCNVTFTIALRDF